MRVTRDENGDFIVEDEPIYVEGAAAQQFLAEMKQRDEVGNDSARRLFLDECDRLYRATKCSAK